MDGADGWNDFFTTLQEAARAARTTLIDRTIEAHGPRARERVARLREQNPGVGIDALADRLIAESAFEAASVGAAVAAPAVIPGPGTIVSVALAAPEIPWLLRHQVKLVLNLAALYDHDPADRDARGGDMEGLFQCAFATVHLGNTVTQLLLTAAMRRGRRRMAAALASAFVLLAGGGMALRRGRLLRRLPLLGVPIGALSNAIAVASVGNEAKQRYRPEAPPPPVLVEEASVPEDEPPTAEDTHAAPEDAAFMDEPRDDESIVDEPLGDEPSE